MVRNFLGFCEAITRSQKKAPKTVFLNIRRNVLSFTGNNVRKIKKMLDKIDVSELESRSVKENLICC